MQGMKLPQYLSLVIVSFCLLGCAGHSMNENDDNAETSVTLGGGGRPDMAQAGGPDGAAADAALSAIEQAIGAAA